METLSFAAALKVIAANTTAARVEILILIDFVNSKVCVYKRDALVQRRYYPPVKICKY